MTDTTERAEFLALADRIDIHVKHGTSPILEPIDVQKVASALRRLASQDRKPVAHPYVKNIDGSPLYLSPPPAAGLDEALRQFNVHEYVGEYEYRGDQDYKPNEHEQAMLEDSIRGAIAEIESLRATPAATKPADAGGVQSEYERGFEAGRKSWSTIIEQHKAYTAEIENILSHQPAPVAANASAEAKNYLYWAVGRWNAEVLSRPLQNIHRRSFDAAWRQVIRHFGGDDRELCGPTHDELLDGAHPHASACDKQETTKSEGGVEGHARSTKADSARGEAGSAPSQDGSLAQLAAGIESGPSERTADVTVDDLSKFICREIPICIHSRVGDFLARALLAAYGMWRR